MAGKITPIKGSVPSRQPELTVQSFDGLAASFFGLRGERYNPDMLAARKGGLSVYRKMRVDEQVKAVLKFKRDAIIGRGFEFVFDGTQLSVEEQKVRTRVMQQTVRQMEGSFADGLTGILSGMDYGFSLTEFVTQTITVDGSQFIGIAKMLARDARDFKFYTDDYGTLTRFVQCVNSREIDLDYGRFIHYVQNPHEDPYYGCSELQAAYRAWFMKDLDLKFWAAFKERMAGGFLAISLGESGITPTHAAYPALQSVLSNMRSSMGIILPNGVTAELHMPSTTDAYEKAIQFHDLAIAKALLIPNLLGLSHTGQTGSYSQSQTQIEAFFMTLVTDSQRVEQCVNDQLFKPLALQNWDDGEFPRFRFKNASEEHIKALVANWTALVTAGAVIMTPKDEAHLRELMNFPEREEGDEALAKIKQDLVPIQEDPNKVAALAAKSQGSAAVDAPKFTSSPPVDAIKKIMADSGLTMDPKVEAQLRSVCDVVEVAKVAEVAAAVDDTKKFSLDSALQRVDFAYIAQRSLALEEDVGQRVSNATARALFDALGTEKLAALIASPDSVGQVDIDRVSIGKIKGEFKQLLERAWSTGLNQAMVEVAKARKGAYSADDRKLRFKSLRDSAADFFESNSFRMAGNLTDAMRAMIQQQLLQAVKTGKRPEDVAAEIYDRMIRKGFTTLNAVKAAETREEVLAMVEQLLMDALDVANVPAYINTLTRTNTFEALNEARYAEFTDPAVADFVQALQYSAILDDRTTQICRELDGHVHTEGSKIWDKYRPPNHYNCRSVLFAVTALDGWDGVESQPPTVEPQEGFK